MARRDQISYTKGMRVHQDTAMTREEYMDPDGNNGNPVNWRPGTSKRHPHAQRDPRTL